MTICFVLTLKSLYSCLSAKKQHGKKYKYRLIILRVSLCSPFYRKISLCTAVMHVEFPLKLFDKMANIHKGLSKNHQPLQLTNTGSKLYKSI